MRDTETNYLTLPLPCRHPVASGVDEKARGAALSSGTGKTEGGVLLSEQIRRRVVRQHVDLFGVPRAEERLQQTQVQQVNVLEVGRNQLSIGDRMIRYWVWSLVG